MATKERIGGSGKPPERKGSRSEASPSEAIPVSEKFLRELFSSQEFISLLAKARKGMQNYVHMHGFQGVEHGFGIIKALATEDAYFTKVVAKTSGVSMDEADSTPIDQAVSLMLINLQKRFSGKKFASFGNLHFHAHPVEPDPVIVPSGIGDLKGSFRGRISNQEIMHYDFLGLDLVAQMTSDGETKILVYQEPLTHSPFIHPAIEEEIGEEFFTENFESQEEVLQLMRQYQYKVAIVRTVGGTFDEEGLKTLAGFAFEPKKIEYDESEEEE